MTDTVILAVVLEANLARINSDPELSRRFATLDMPPTQDLLRPVSVNAVASSLRLPYETVRRRIRKMSGLGACVITPQGVYVPTTAVDNPYYRVTATARYERMKTLYFELKDLGGLDGLNVRPADAPRHAAPPVRAANRLMSEYSLRVIDTVMRRLPDPVSGLVLLEMARANAEHLTRAEKEYEGPLPDSMRRPISMLALAKRMNLPAETVRRHVKRLEAEGFCRPVGIGRLAALEQLGKSEGGFHGLAENLANAQRLLARAAALGILAYWEDEVARGAA